MKDKQNVVPILLMLSPAQALTKLVRIALNENSFNQTCATKVSDGDDRGLSGGQLCPNPGARSNIGARGIFTCLNLSSPRSFVTWIYYYEFKMEKNVFS